jgi:hypothetical protein
MLSKYNYGDYEFTKVKGKNGIMSESCYKKLIPKMSDPKTKAWLKTKKITTSGMFLYKTIGIQLSEKKRKKFMNSVIHFKKVCMMMEYS